MPPKNASPVSIVLIELVARTAAEHVRHPEFAKITAKDQISLTLNCSVHLHD
jgi:hypothetical protein